MKCAITPGTLHRPPARKPPHRRLPRYRHPLQLSLPTAQPGPRDIPSQPSLPIPPRWDTVASPHNSRCLLGRPCYRLARLESFERHV
ncbi:hypothetical protein Ssi02_23210 [Sinosporangium siamense]|uniref:Uncharacterized protein n=1 Tax=Sinosporangium siamense TaxID=1367973 RepID=A0A919RG17_9ACTN|nr:hypothetical protein Ssi02_23210 [Sinosporangium siamense]